MPVLQPKAGTNSLTTSSTTQNSSHASRPNHRGNNRPVTTDQRPDMAFVDRGYRGHGVETVKVFISGARRGVTRTIAKLLRRRSAIEPIIGHMKTDGRLTRCPLKGTTGDALFAVLCGCGHNIRMILRHLR